MRNDGTPDQGTTTALESSQNIDKRNHYQNHTSINTTKTTVVDYTSDNNVLTQVDTRLKKSIQPDYFPDFTDKWYQSGNGLLFLGYGSVYSVYLLDATAMPLMAMSLYSFGWNYIELITRLVVHVYNLIKRACGHQKPKSSFVSEAIDILATLVLGAGTVLSTLATAKVLTGVVAVACTPLANLAAGFCSIMMSVIDLVKCYKAYQKTKLPMMLRDRLERFAQINQDLNRHEHSIQSYRKLLENEQEAMARQLIAIARVGLAEGRLTQKAVVDLIKSQGLAQDSRFQLTTLQQPPSEAEKARVQQMRNRHREIVRTHAFGAGFWFLAGVGICLATLTSAFFPVLLIPAIAVISVAIMMKGIELLELDKRLYNRFASKAHQKTITRDNSLFNFLARHYQAKQIIKSYTNDEKKLSLVHQVIRESRFPVMSMANRVKMRLTYELMIPPNHHHQPIEKQFYKKLLNLSWRQRQQRLDHAMNSQLEKKALSACQLTKETTAQQKVADYKKSLTIDDKKYYTAKWCRENYCLFKTKKTASHPTTCTTGTANQMATNCQASF